MVTKHFALLKQQRACVHVAVYEALAAGAASPSVAEAVFLVFAGDVAVGENLVWTNEDDAWHQVAGIAEWGHSVLAKKMSGQCTGCGQGE